MKLRNDTGREWLDGREPRVFCCEAIPALVSPRCNHIVHRAVYDLDVKWACEKRGCAALALYQSCMTCSSRGDDIFSHIPSGNIGPESCTNRIFDILV